MNLSKEDVKMIISRMELLISEKRMKKREFYERSGISSSLYSQWNTGAVIPSMVSIGKVADALGVSVEYLLYGEKEKPATNSDGQNLVNNDRELTDLLERVRDDPDLRMLFSLTKDAKPEDVKKAIQIIKMFQGD